MPESVRSSRSTVRVAQQPKPTVAALTNAAVVHQHDVARLHPDQLLVRVRQRARVVCYRHRVHVRSWDHAQRTELVRQVLQVPDGVYGGGRLVVAARQVRVAVSVEPAGYVDAAAHAQLLVLRGEGRERKVVDLRERTDDGAERVEDPRVRHGGPHLLRGALEHIVEPVDARLQRPLA